MENEQPQSLRDQFFTHIAFGRYDAVEELWLAQDCSKPGLAGAFHETARELVRKGEKNRAVALLQMTLPAMLAVKCWGELKPLLASAAEWSPHEIELRKALAKCYRTLNTSHPEIEKYIDGSGLLKFGGVPEAVSRIEKLLPFRIGGYIIHPVSYGVGRITSINAETLMLTVDFQFRPNHPVPVDTIGQHMQSLKPTDYRVMEIHDVQGLKKLALASPGEILAKLLKAHGPKMTLKDVRAALIPVVLSKEEWSKWLPTAKQAITASSCLRASSDRFDEVELCENALTLVGEINDRLADIESASDAVMRVRECMRLARGSSEHDNAADAIRGALKGIFAEHGRTDADRLLFALLFDDLRSEGFRIELAAVDTEAIERSLTAFFVMPDIVVKSLEEIYEPAVYRETVCRWGLEKLKDHWLDFTAGRFLSLPHDVWTVCAEQLLDAGRKDALAAVYASLSRATEHNAVEFMKFHHTLDSGRLAKAGLITSSAADIVRNFLKASDNVTEKEDVKNARQMFKTHAAALVNDVVEKATDMVRQELMLLVRWNRVLSPQIKEQMQDVIKQYLPDTSAPKGTVVTPDPEDTEPIYSTPAGIEKQQRKLEHLVNVRMNEIARDIGKAIEHGDVSDNAEYRAALEMRDQVSKAAEHMRLELKRVKLIDAEMLKPDTVTIGTKVEAVDTATGQEMTLVVLGPWEADVKSQVISYKAPLAKGLINKKAGETVAVETPDGTRTLTIKGVSPAI
jgi:transcription elongation factor GreA